MKKTCKSCRYYDHPCDFSRGQDDTCQEYKASLTWAWYVLVLVIVLSMIVFCFGGCSADSIGYTHTWTDPNGPVNTVKVTYREGLGNSEKTNIKVVLSDGSTLSAGNSITNQDELIKAFQQFMLVAQKALEAYLRTQVIP